MLSRLIEMVSFILSKSIENEDDDWYLLRRELTEHLQGQGYNGPEIDIAFEVANRIRSRIEDGPSVSLSIKTNQVYIFLEAMKLTKEARGYLMTLMHDKVITPEQREEIVERAYFLEYPELGLEEIQYLVNLVLGGDSWPGEELPSMTYTLQ